MMKNTAEFTMLALAESMVHLSGARRRLTFKRLREADPSQR
jgi:hypothetical protein